LKTLSLFELNHLLRTVLEDSFPETFLVTAEIASCNVKRHCYLTLVDKEDDLIRAEMDAVIWADKYNKLSAVFTEATGASLSKGIKILFEASISFHERYGLKLNIVNIDPSYTIGEMAVKRKEILERLLKEGIKDKNKELEFPLVPQRIAIVSSSTAAGYEDLMTHLTNNSYGYKFSCKLYEALMQGDRAEESVVSALQKCMADASDLDLVVIVRGGGGQADLQCFNSYEMAKMIAFLPVPVISGIGHERDITVVDEVSNMRAKTPTAVADLIITKVKDFEDRLDSLRYNLVSGTQRLTSDERERVAAMTGGLEAAVRNEQVDSAHRLSVFMKGLKYSLKLIQSQKERLRFGESNVSHLNPANVLKRGYSITYNNGRAIRSASDAEDGDTLMTVLHKGKLTSKVEKKRRRKANG
jgi:exodeoxyribonuclease VII large subunit